MGPVTDVTDEHFWLGPGSKAIPSKADSKRSLSRPRRMMRYLLGPTG